MSVRARARVRLNRPGLCCTDPRSLHGPGPGFCCACVLCTGPDSVPGPGFARANPSHARGSIRVPEHVPCDSDCRDSGRWRPRGDQGVACRHWHCRLKKRRWSSRKARRRCPPCARSRPAQPDGGRPARRRSRRPSGTTGTSGAVLRSGSEAPELSKEPGSRAKETVPASIRVKRTLEQLGFRVKPACRARYRIGEQGILPAAGSKKPFQKLIRYDWGG